MRSMQFIKFANRGFERNFQTATVRSRANPKSMGASWVSSSSEMQWVATLWRWHHGYPDHALHRWPAHRSRYQNERASPKRLRAFSRASVHVQNLNTALWTVSVAGVACNKLCKCNGSTCQHKWLIKTRQKLVYPGSAKVASLYSSGWSVQIKRTQKLATNGTLIFESKCSYLTMLQEAKNVKNLTKSCESCINVFEGVIW